MSGSLRRKRNKLKKVFKGLLSIRRRDRKQKVRPKKDDSSSGSEHELNATCTAMIYSHVVVTTKQRLHLLLRVSDQGRSQGLQTTLDSAQSGSGQSDLCKPVIEQEWHKRQDDQSFLLPLQTEFGLSTMGRHFGSLTFPIPLLAEVMWPAPF
jgi:hypothetical protein